MKTQKSKQHKIQQHNKETQIQKHSKFLVYTNTMGWLGDGSHRGQGRESLNGFGAAAAIPPKLVTHT